MKPAGKLFATCLMFFISACTWANPIIPTEPIQRTVIQTITGVIAVPTETYTATSTSTQPATHTPLLTPTRAQRKPSPTLTETLVTPKMVPDEYKKYIGLRFRELPEGFTGGLTMMVGEDFGLGVAKDGITSMLWFSKLSDHDDQGKAYWILVDILVLPTMNTKTEFIVSGGCTLGEKKEIDEEIIAIAKFDEEVQGTRYVTNEKILRAWRMNRHTEAFEEFPTDGIECSAELGFMIE